MKAIVMSKVGKPEVLQLQEVPDPQIKTATQVLVRLKAAGVNPIDTKLRSRGTFYPDQMPAILGCDGAGVVEAVGSEVEDFAVGDEVYFCDGGLGAQTGNYAELTVVEEKFITRKPISLGFAEAAAAPLVLITAWEALYDRGRLQPGQQVLIHAGAGGVGHVAIQLAKLQGAEVATTVSSTENAAFVQELGADLVINYKQEDFVQAILHWTQGEGVDLAFDTVGKETFFQTVYTVRNYGDIVTLLEPDFSIGNLKDARTKNLRISLELMLTPMLQNREDDQLDQTKILQQCARLIDENKLNICLNQTFPLAEAAASHQLLEAGGMKGKLALVINDKDDDDNAEG
ncbi:zinc-dependent alcohol dehydrogenase family protein [Arthrospira platensis]|jgi:NADPH2:quinone reductase|uniref:Zinc-containing alcohol dehydrogenase n=1 Tax=Limnospira platensis NIES-46 TaxID=1236695 RepID=A0A5M3T7C6_LIMPL|nr:zinc-dependent alcohol dehydrogenase family protein [Arthrospira platensis]KDR57756.1 alcohol dehydrogenase [Arthrospira platensis str. Paraca]MBD2668528.1 zinc-dependent alcohol dehydrogenase family protein [Arthrospira platensis FACHB-439]MBD2710204.1 zinc-dependent alcohol dehydrogenase family protein [Arthrospira platensis FACHB-835]MDF2211135.1 zinc-dependent alcohol dehydrogenase family protein [Arthrospira platensis NCB002]MDT9181667.1 zinc-dependent alcohol dehydrogenase family prot